MGLRNDLIEARKLIDTPETWTKHKLIRAIGLHKNARCAEGACWSVRGANARAMTDALRRVIPSGFGWAGNRRPPLAVYNDDATTTHADIMALFDRAINDAALDELRKPVDEVRE